MTSTAHPSRRSLVLAGLALASTAGAAGATNLLPGPGYGPAPHRPNNPPAQGEHPLAEHKGRRFERPASLALSAEASKEVSTDEMSVTLFAVAEGPTASALSAQVMAKLKPVLELSKSNKAIEGFLNSLNTRPQYDKSGQRKGWRVQGEVVLRSKDTVALSTAVGELTNGLQIQGVNYSVSEELAKKTREALVEEAAAAFKSKAASTAKALGYASYDIEEMSLGEGVHSAPPMAFKARGMVESAAASFDLPTEGAKSRIAVTFNGKVRLRR